MNLIANIIEEHKTVRFISNIILINLLRKD